MLHCCGGILCKTGEVTENLQGGAEVWVTFPKNSVFLGLSLSALDSVTVRAKAFTLVPTVIKYNHVGALIGCFQVTLMCKNLSARHKREVISCNVSYVLSLTIIFLLYDIFFLSGKLRNERIPWLTPGGLTVCIPAQRYTLEIVCWIMECFGLECHLVPLG